MNQVFAMGGAIPPPPTENSWPAYLRWLLAVMNDDDSSIGFVAGCLSYVSAHGALTAKQIRGCKKVLERVSRDFEHLQLDCQDVAVTDG